MGSADDIILNENVFALSQRQRGVQRSSIK